MASAIQIPVAEYLQTTYRPDREYVDGEVLERNVGKWEHGRVQWLLASWFSQHEGEWNVMGSTEQRVRVGATRIRVPDLVVVRPEPQPEVLTEAPVLIVEILSPDDSYSSLEERCGEYLRMGDVNLWIIDPRTRTGRMCTNSGWVPSERLVVEGTPIFVELPALFVNLQKPKQ